MSEANGKSKVVLIGIGAVVVAVAAWAGFQAGPAGNDASGTIMSVERYRADQDNGSDGEAADQDKAGQGSADEELERSGDDTGRDDGHDDGRDHGRDDGRDDSRDNSIIVPK